MTWHYFDWREASWLSTYLSEAYPAIGSINHFACVQPRHGHKKNGGSVEGTGTGGDSESSTNKLNFINSTCRNHRIHLFHRHPNITYHSSSPHFPPPTPPSIHRSSTPMLDLTPLPPRFRSTPDFEDLPVVADAPSSQSLKIPQA